jgi:hypothetical protein
MGSASTLVRWKNSSPNVASPSPMNMYEHDVGNSGLTLLAHSRNDRVASLRHGTSTKSMTRSKGNSTICGEPSIKTEMSLGFYERGRSRPERKGYARKRQCHRSVWTSHFFGAGSVDNSLFVDGSLEIDRNGIGHIYSERIFNCRSWVGLIDQTRRVLAIEIPGRA